MKKTMILGLVILIAIFFGLCREAGAVDGLDEQSRLTVMSEGASVELINPELASDQEAVIEETETEQSQWWDGMTVEEITADLKGLIEEGNVDEAAIKFSELANGDSDKAGDVLSEWIKNTIQYNHASSEEELGKLFINSNLDTTAFAKALRGMDADNATAVISRAIGAALSYGENIESEDIYKRSANIIEKVIELDNGDVTFAHKILDGLNSAYDGDCWESVEILFSMENIEYATQILEYDMGEGADPDSSTHASLIGAFFCSINPYAVAYSEESANKAADFVSKMDPSRAGRIFMYKFTEPYTNVDRTCKAIANCLSRMDEESADKRKEIYAEMASGNIDLTMKIWAYQYFLYGVPLS